METLTTTLSGRVDALIPPHRSDWPPLSTTATQVAIAELIERTEGFEKAIREIALEVERLAASH